MLTSFEAAQGAALRSQLLQQSEAIAIALSVVTASEDALAPTPDDAAWVGPASDAYRAALAAVRLLCADAAASLRAAAVATDLDLAAVTARSGE